MSTAPQASHQRRSVERREGKYWIGMFGGAVAWLAHLVLSYLLAEFGCESRLANYSFLGVTAVAWSLLALSLLTVLAALAAAGIAYRNRPPQGGGRESAPDFLGRQFAAHMGLIADCAFAIVIVFESVPIVYYLQHC